MTASTAILQALFNCDGIPVTETVLLCEARIMSGSIGEGEFQSTLTRLRQGKFAEVETDELTGDRKWIITAKGRERLSPTPSKSKGRK